jgi:hypothetical protein
MEGWVSFVVWETSGKGVEIAHVQEMPAGDCTPDSFADAVDELRYVSGGIFSAVRWIIIEESFPGDLSGDPSSKIGQGNHHLPAWMRQCWEDLPASYLPGCVTSGSRCLLSLLDAWEEFHQTGTGIFFALLGRGYFFGFGERECLLRISRQSADASGGLSDEWIRQTSMLYRNRTGTELTQILVLGDQTGIGLNDQKANVAVRTVLNPPNWMRWAQGDGSVELKYFHAAGLLASGKGKLEIDLIEQGRDGRRLDKALRWCSFLLMGTWMLLWIGACRNTDVPADRSESEIRLWEDERTRWEQSHRRWLATKESRDREAAPFRLAGVLARSLPDATELDRIHLEMGQKGVPFEVEGSYHGVNASDEFKAWFARLGNETPPVNIRNLEFEPFSKGLHFRVTGDVDIGGEFK